MLDVAAIVKAFASAVSGARAVESVSKWLQRDNREPLKRAFDQTVESFEAEFPAIRETLLALLETPEFPAQLESLVLRPNAGVSDVAAEWVRVTGFYLPEAPDAAAAMERVLAALLENYDRERLLGPEGLVWMDKKLAQRHAEMINVKVGVSDLGELKTRVQETLEAAKDKSFDDAREMWRREERALARAGTSDPSLEFQVLSSIANLSWRHGRTDEAAEYFLKAAAADPMSPKAHATLGLGLMIRGDKSGALAAVAKEPIAARRRKFTAQIHSWFREHAEALALLSPTLDTTPDPDELALGVVCLAELDDLESAERVARRFVLLAPDQARSHFVLSGVLRQLASKATRGESRSKVQILWQQADAALAQASSLGTVAERSMALTERALIAVLVGSRQQALDHAEAAVRNDATNNKAIIVLTEIALAQEVDRTPLLDPLLASGQPEAYDLAMRAARTLKHPPERANTLLARARGQWPHDMPIEVWRSAYGLAEALGDTTQVAEILDAAPAAARGIAKLVRARTAIAAADIDEAKRLLRDASGELTREDGVALLELGSAALRVEEFALARTAYERFGVSLAMPDEVVGGYCFALSRTAGGDEALIHMLQLAPLAECPVPLVEACVYVYENRGDLRSSRKLWASLHERFPSEERWTLGMAVADYRLGDAASAAQLVAGIHKERLEGVDLLKAAELSRLVGNTPASIGFAFEAWKQAPDDPQTCAAYVQLFFEATRGQSAAFLERKGAVDRTVVRVDIDGDERAVLIAGTPELPSVCGVKTYPAASEIGVRVLGRTVGERFEWQDAPGGKVHATVKELLSPELFACRFAMDQASIGSPGRATIRKFRVGDDPLGQIEGVLRDGRLAQDEGRMLVQSKPLPMGVMARLLHVSTYELWAGLIEGGEPGVRSNANTLEEQQRGRDTTRAAKEMLIDPVSLLTLSLLDAFDVLEKLRIKARVVQATIDVLVQQRTQLEPLREEGDLRVAYVAGQVVPSKRTPEQVNAACALLDRAIAFVRSAETIPLHRALTEAEERIEEVLGPEFVHSLVASEKSPLLSDDMLFRTLANSGAAGRTASTACLLATAVESGAIDSGRYSGMIVRLVRANYRNVPISVAALSGAVQSGLALRDYGELVEALVRPEADRRSVLNVYALHIQQVCTSTVIWEAVEPYLRVCTEIIGRVIGFKNVAAIVEAIFQRAIVLPASAVRLRALIETFVR